MTKSQTTRPIVRSTKNPVHVHDCACCKFVGGAIVNKQMVDYYRCEDTIIARFGDNPEENRSLPEFIVNQYKGQDETWLNYKKL